MKKIDLKNGMIVENRDGDKFIVIKNFTELTKIPTDCRDVLLNINFGEYDTLDEYEEDLTNGSFKDLDIVKVYYLEHPGCEKDELILLWERKENLKIIEEQINEIKKYFRIERTSLKEKEDEYEIDVILENGEETTIYIDEEIIKNGDNFVFNKIISSIHVTIMNEHCDKVVL